MEPTSLSDDASASLCPEHRSTLLMVARRSIEHGLRTQSTLKLNLVEYAAPLQQRRASFVTLRLNGQLRGCIGMLEATRPLVEDVAENAYAAAFRDARFGPLAMFEFERIGIHISLLSAPQAMCIVDEQDLLRQLRPGVDGLILEEPAMQRRGTFLPAVWESLADPQQFVEQLKVKAGLPVGYWSDTLTFSRYTAESVGGE